VLSTSLGQGPNGPFIPEVVSLFPDVPVIDRLRPIFTLEDWARVLVQRNWPAMSASGTKRTSRLQVVGQLIRAAAERMIKKKSNSIPMD
jgi:hypothetical protein